MWNSTSSWSVNASSNQVGRVDGLEACAGVDEIESPDRKTNLILTYIDDRIDDCRLFSGRRWSNPADPDDRARLDAAYADLVSTFPPFAAACSREHFLQTLADASAFGLRRRSGGKEPRRTLADSERAPPPLLLLEPFLGRRAAVSPETGGKEEAEEVQEKELPLLLSRRFPRRPTTPSQVVFKYDTRR